MFDYEILCYRLEYRNIFDKEWTSLVFYDEQLALEFIDVCKNEKNIEYRFLKIFYACDC